MSGEKRENNQTAAEWMDFYEDLFKDNDPVKGTPIPLGGGNDEENEDIMNGSINSIINMRDDNVY